MMANNRIGKRTLRIHLEIGDRWGHKNKYSLKPLSSEGSRVWKLLKLEANGKKVQTVYELRFEEELGFSCSCPGYAGHGHCKHSGALAVLLRPLVASRTSVEV